MPHCGAALGTGIPVCKAVLLLLPEVQANEADRILTWGHERLAPGATEVFLGSRLIHPVSLSTVMAMQSILIVASWQRLLRIFR